MSFAKYGVKHENLTVDQQLEKILFNLGCTQTCQVYDSVTIKNLNVSVDITPDAYNFQLDSVQFFTNCCLGNLNRQLVEAGYKHRMWKVKIYYNKKLLFFEDWSKDD
jgi:hypothetical protein